MDTINAKIESTFLGLEDHGILTFFLTLRFGESSAQGFGGYALDSYDKTKDKRVGHAFGTAVILEIFNALEVREWEKLSGVPVRVRVDKEGCGQKILAIGHFLKDQWVDMKALSKEYFDHA